MPNLGEIELPFWQTAWATSFEEKDKDAFFPSFRFSTTHLISVNTVLQLSPKALELLSKLDDFGTLEPNWDSYDAVPPNLETINAAKEFVLMCDRVSLPLYFTAPGPNGEIIVELNDKSGKMAEIFFLEDGLTEILTYQDEKLQETSNKIDITPLLKFFNGSSSYSLGV